jgi:hypothetical protein
VEGVTQVSALVVVPPTAAIAADHPSEEVRPRIHLAALGACLSALVAKGLGQVQVVRAMGEEGLGSFLVDFILVEEMGVHRTNYTIQHVFLKRRIGAPTLFMA